MCILIFCLTVTSSLGGRHLRKNKPVTPLYHTDHHTSMTKESRFKKTGIQNIRRKDEQYNNKYKNNNCRSHLKKYCTMFKLQEDLNIITSWATSN